MTQATGQIRSEDWWRSWFNTLYLNVYSHRDDSQADREIRTTLATLPLHPGHRILDLCCGNGRHTRALLRAGFSQTIGLDYSPHLLKYALSEKPHGKNYLRGDMRMLPLAGETLDAALSYFTSFGYFKTNVENLKVLHEMSRALKSGGWFLFDYLNSAHVRKTFEPESTRKQGEYCIHERRWFSEDGERIEKEITIENWGEETRTFHESVRLYSYEEMQDMMKAADLFILGALGDFEGRTFEESTPRMILYGTRK